MNLYFLKHNNYYNRRYKPINSLTGATVLGYLYNVSNFDPADGVDTTQETAYETFTDIPDYMLAMEGEEIVSRWYVVEAKRIRGGKYRLDLHRDVIADYFADIENAPMFIEKGYVPYSNPLIFNKEQMSFNKVKKHEILLNNGFEGAWLVGYIARNAVDIEGSTTFQTPYVNIIVDSLSSWEYWKYCTENENKKPLYTADYNHKFRVYYKPTGALIKRYEEFDSTDRVVHMATAHDSETTCSINDPTGLAYEYDNYKTDINNLVAGQIGTTSISVVSNILSLEGQILRTEVGGVTKYYKIRVNSGAENVEGYLSAGALYNKMYEWVTASGGTNINDKTLWYSTSTTSYTISIEDITGGYTASFKLPATRRHLIDAPYDMIVFPWLEGKFSYTVGNVTAIHNIHKQDMFDIAMNFAKNAGSNLYDLQLLPYCPINGLELKGTNITTPSEFTDVDYTLIKDKDNQVWGIVYYGLNSNFTVNIPMANSTAYNYLTKVETDAIERKVKNECDLVRICSPNGSNSFDFSPQMNDGFDYIQVDCTYKPYNPYIHVAPDFAGLYGDNFGDTRGLIVQGDFSLPVITDAWVQYEISNKNYANVFDRETQSLEFKENIRRSQAGWTIASSIISGMGSGSALGKTVGGLGVSGAIGTGVGALVGGATLAGASIADYVDSKKLYAEQMDYRQDMYNMNLENIQARPNGLAKTSAFTNNNKIYPFIEYYTATDVEKEALRSKIKYNGMTIGVIGKIMDYVGSTETYVKGSLITADINDDYHTVQAINNELNMGIRIGG